MTLMQEFHADYEKVVGALFELRQAIAALDIARVVACAWMLVVPVAWTWWTG